MQYFKQSIYFEAGVAAPLWTCEGIATHCHRSIYSSPLLMNVLISYVLWTVDREIVDIKTLPHK